MTILISNAAADDAAIRSCRKPTANDRAEYGPHWDALSLREARNGTNAVKYTA